MSNSSNNEQKDEMLSAVSYLASAYDEVELLMNKHTDIEIKISTLEYEIEKLNSLNATKLVKGYFRLVLICLTLGLYLIFLYFSAKKNDAKKIEYEQDLNNQISNLSAEKSTLENQILAFARTDQWIKAKSLLPKEVFQSSEIVHIIHNYVTSGRADTWKEAYNLYIDESHKARMEELAIAQLDVAEQSLQIQKEICESTKGLLNVSIEQRNELFKMNKSLQQQEQIMLEIRKNTKQSAKSARIAAFCTVIGLFK